MKCFLLFLLLPSALLAQDLEREQGLITNSPFWRQALGGNVMSLPSAQAGSAVVALDGGSIKAYSTSGNPMWTYSARSRISPYVSRSREGTSYLSRANGTLIAVNRAGRELWRRELGAPLAGRVISGWDGRLFVPVDKKLFCYTAAGTLLWTKTFSHSFLLAPKLDRQGGVIFALTNNEAQKISAFGKAETWDIGRPPSALLSIEDGLTLAVFTDGSMEILGESQDWFFSAQEGGHARILPRFQGRPLAAASRESGVVSVLDDGRVSLISITERNIIWTEDSHIREFIKNGGRPDAEAEIIFNERGVYVLNKNGATCFTHDGKRLWYTFLQNAASVPAFGDDGILYSGGRDWILYAYKIEDNAPPVKSGLYGPLPEGSYGTGTPNAAYLPKIPVFDDEIQSILDNYQTDINLGTVGENELSMAAFLLTLTQGQRPIQVKVRAINLLGQIGSRETVPYLANIFRRDPEPLVRAAAATAIGEIGVDPDGVAIHTFLQALIPDTIKDEQLLQAITKATGELCRFSGPPLSGTGIQILNLLTASGLPSGIRSLAEKELDSLR